MIEGVKVKRLTKYCDDRGFFAELVRDDEHLLEHFGQASVSMSYPGVIKAFHYHDEQDDLWYFPSGNAQVVLHDLRPNSKTAGITDVYYMGEENPILLLIPKGVAHGYRVLGGKPATIIYFTTKSYNRESPDEKRLAWDDPSINFDWTTKHR
ncbi:dTDP-4-dehydrorhamnose 3,5-epimerase family protein [Halalkalibacterium halodurans]|jgi:dTDP-4-dehydrorhamnose 3,5-epimerase|uniref:Spore coat protein n=1 Tax=Halalkalibacterium halodurans TaxID=86665 RepID=A0A0M0KGD5_ALKHA|nr:dTDP-4-dehydrorhamnose 3,5-epimerase family protein [Halalkalibacterium halodurans]MED4080642.1 dTDP-4-dehydrorhamnose 3,5-epimerase family protein [Halalkalibacterium halodurans]MED4085671.1 dTDP-4-dehydrorhamnose 3,5-epimerase family protein [Halalkalibacterium halodurans]MED4106329.1 dTDP-4-dehydrorhamnose 3,5-epimerase family protein [Halalkalibacterium halodurans]MED4108525.1 dTDP-4-dehydrorhamnose 3,5-epimerase family protein [Halalkalibacterium halodurans]MED4124741.1 dTDP-4-dehydror